MCVFVCFPSKATQCFPGFRASAVVPSGPLLSGNITINTNEGEKLQNVHADEAEGYLWWDDASADDQDVRTVELPQFLEQLGDEGLVSRGERADPDAVHVCVHRLLGHLQGSL